LIAELESPVVLEDVRRAPLLLLIYAFAVCGSAQGRLDQEDDLSTKVTKLSAALGELRKSPHDRTAQMRYLEEFPKTYKEYLQFFDLGKPLYDSHEYVDVISQLAANYELAVGSILVNLSQDAHYDADAPAYLQRATSGFAGQHTQTFVGLLKGLPWVKETNLITFLADVENHRAYPEYQLIPDHLKALGEIALANKFELARAERKRQPHG
jgi:hypothetical protein